MFKTLPGDIQAIRRKESPRGTQQVWNQKCFTPRCSRVGASSPVLRLIRFSLCGLVLSRLSVLNESVGPSAVTFFESLPGEGLPSFYR